MAKTIEIHIGDEGEIGSVQVTETSAFIRDWSSVNRDLENYPVNAEYVGIVHPEGVTLIAWDNCHEMEPSHA